MFGGSRMRGLGGGKEAASPCPTIAKNGVFSGQKRLAVAGSSDTIGGVNRLTILVRGRGGERKARRIFLDTRSRGS